MRKNESNKQWILKQLEQLEIDTQLLEKYSLSELYTHCDQILRSTYSIKYLGMNNNEMGVISRRLDPFKDTKFSLDNLAKNSYLINSYFYPKPLKVTYKKERNEKINSQNLEEEIITAFSKQSHENFRKNFTTSHQKKHSGKVYKPSLKKEKSEVLRVIEETKNKSLKKKIIKNPSDFLEENTKGSLSFSYSQFLKSGLIYAKD